MAETLLESVKDGDNKLRVGVIKIITERSPILERIPWQTITGNAFTYDIEQSLPTLAFRGVGGTYTANTGVINRVTERLTIFGGEVKIDNFQVRTQGSGGAGVDVKVRQYRMKARALAIQFSELFFEADQDVTANSFNGIRRRIGTSQIVNAGNTGATLTLAMLDQLCDEIVGGPEDLWLNKTLRRKVTALGRAGNAGGHSFIDVGTSSFGKQVERYNGVMLNIIERDDDESTFLGFDEDDADAGGGNLDTASIYGTRFGDEYLHGIQGGGGSMEVHDFGEMQAEPSHLGRIEWYPGLVSPHPRPMARLMHINNA